MSIAYYLRGKDLPKFWALLHGDGVLPPCPAKEWAAATDLPFALLAGRNWRGKADFGILPVEITAESIVSTFLQAVKEFGEPQKYGVLLDFDDEDFVRVSRLVGQTLNFSDYQIDPRGHPEWHRRAI